MFSKIKHFLLTNQSPKQTVLKNTVWLFTGELISRLLKFFLVIYAARILGAAQWGVFSYVLSFLALFGIFSDFGFNTLITREIARNKEENKASYLSTVFALKMLCTVVAAILLFFVGPLLSNIPEVKNVIVIIALFFFFESLREFGIALNRAFERMEREAVVNVLTNFSISILGLLFIWRYPSVKNLSIAYLIGTIIGLVCIIYLLRFHLKGILKNFSKNLIRPIMQYAWPFAILSLSGNIMTNTDLLMLGWFKGSEDIGLYSVAQRLTQFLYIIPAILSVALFPSFSKLAQESRERFNGIFNKIIHFLFILGVPIVAGGILLSTDIILLAFGYEYQAAGVTFGILLVMTIINFSSTILANAVVAYNQQQTFLRYTLFAVTLNVLLNLLLIPLMGINGAAVATVVSNGIGTGLIFYFFLKKNKFIFLLPLRNICISTVIMLLCITVLKFSNVSVMIIVPLSIIVYGSILYLLKDSLITYLFLQKTPRE